MVLVNAEEINEEVGGPLTQVILSDERLCVVKG